MNAIRQLRFAILATCLPFAGCGPSFDSPVDEYEYLASQANPTPAQWKRMKELGATEIEEMMPAAPGEKATMSKTTVYRQYQARKAFDEAAGKGR